jgi:MFS family permease
MPESSALRMTSNAFRALSATLSVQVLVAMAAVTVPVLAPAAAREVGVSAGYVGFFIAFVYAAGMTASLVSGALVRRIGAIRVSQLCLLSCAAGLWLTATGLVPLLVAGALLIGCGYGPVTPASSHILSRSTPPGRMSFTFSLKQTGVPLGGALAGGVLPTLVLWAGWRAAAVFVGFACIATAALVQPMRAMLDADRTPGQPIGAASMSGPLRLVISQRAIRRLAVSSFFFASLQVCLITYLVTYLTQDLGFSLVQAGLMLAVAQGAGAAGRLAWGAISDRGRRPLQVLGVLGCAMAVFAAAAADFTTNWPRLAIVLCCAAFGATAIGWNGVYLAEVARQAPRGRAGDATGGTLFFTFSGVLVGPPAFAFLVEGGVSYSVAFLVVAVPALVCGLALLWVGARRRPAGR